MVNLEKSLVVVVVGVVYVLEEREGYMQSSTVSSDNHLEIGHVVV